MLSQGTTGRSAGRDCRLSDETSGRPGSTRNSTPVFRTNSLPTPYTTFDYSDFEIGAAEIATDGEVKVSRVVRNAGERAGAEVVQLYFADRVAQVTRPVIQLAGFTRAELQPGERAQVTFTLHADRTAFTGVDLRRVVEPGEIELLIGGSSGDIRGRLALRLTGELRVVGPDRVVTTPAGRSPA